MEYELRYFICKNLSGKIGKVNKTYNVQCICERCTQNGH